MLTALQPVLQSLIKRIWIDRRRRRFGLTHHSDFSDALFSSRWYVALPRPQLQIGLTNIQVYRTLGTNKTCQHRSMETIHLMHGVGSTAAV